jgi:hypothetical protein
VLRSEEIVMTQTLKSRVLKARLLPYRTSMLMSVSRAGDMERMRDWLMSWNMRVLDPVLRKTLPWMHRVSDDAVLSPIACGCAEVSSHEERDSCEEEHAETRRR